MYEDEKESGGGRKEWAVVGCSMFCQACVGLVEQEPPSLPLQLPHTSTFRFMVQVFNTSKGE